MKIKFKNSLIYLWLVAVVILFCSGLSAQANIDVSYDADIEKLLGQMTIEEKVGQMTQLTLVAFYEDGVLQEERLADYIQNYHIGSIFNITESAISNRAWINLIKKIQDTALSSRLKIPVLYGIDAIHGATYTQSATLFPHNIGLAASRNPKLAYTSSKVTAQEIRAGGVRWNFDPVLGVGRQPLWPRLEETFGEDTFLVTDFGIQAVKGYEGDCLKTHGHVACCIKHYLGYSLPLHGKDRSPAYIPDIMLWETFIPPFKKAVECDAASIMINSGSINGVPVHANRYLLTDLLKREWGYKGLVLTDWLDIINLHTDHKVTRDNKESVKLAINAGIDMSMVPSDLSFYHDLVSLVKAGDVSEERIDDAVRRILRVKHRVGLFLDPYPEPKAVDNFARKAYAELALQAARETLTLLKNERYHNLPVLPLNKQAKILIAGPGANSLATLHGSWSYCWDGRDETLFPEETLSIREAIENKIGKENCITVAPDAFNVMTITHIQQIIQEAGHVDCIVLCLGENSYAESDGNIDDLTLPTDQIQFAQAVMASTTKPVIAILTQGRPRIIRDIEPGLHGILLAYRPGSQGAQAIADVLFGDYNPSGKLPYTYPQYTGSILPYDAPARNEKYYHPQWSFGHGLSYSQFEMSDMQLSTQTLTGTDTLEVRVTVMNKGPYPGEVTLDLYVRDEVASVIPPMKKLRKYTKQYLKVGESRVVTFHLHKSDLSFVGTDLKRVTEDGYFQVMIGDKTSRFLYRNN